MTQRFVVLLVIIAVLFGGIFVLTKKKNSDKPLNVSNSAPSNHVEGDGKKNVTLIEYGDYQCPACGAYYPIVNQVYAKYKTDIHFQFRNFPLTSIHQHAFEGSRAAEAADKQGKFWEMHDILYENQTSWSAMSDPTPAFEAYAGQLSLNVAKFKDDFKSSAINDLINADIKAGTDLGANSTPTFVLQGKKIASNPRSVDEFYKLIDKAIADQANKK